MLLPIQKHTTTITIVSLFLMCFFLCSWTLAASIVGARAIPQEIAPNSEPAETNNQEAGLAEPNGATPADTDFDPAEKETPAESQAPTGSTQTTPPAETVNSTTMAEISQPIFPMESYSLDVLRGQSGSGKRIALTFDDGPDCDWTAKYLAILSEKNIPATFFFVGRLAAKNTDTVLAAVAAGHEIGVHSHTHRKLTGLGEAQIRQDLIDSATILNGITRQSVAYFRPPYGATNSRVTGVAHELGQTVVTWNVDPRDWETKDSREIVNRVLNQVRPGSIILLHEGKPQTLQALPTVIDRLHQEGYEFVTVSELFGFKPTMFTVADSDDSVTETALPAQASISISSAETALEEAAPANTDAPQL